MANKLILDSNDNVILDNGNAISIDISIGKGYSISDIKKSVSGNTLTIACPSKPIYFNVIRTSGSGTFSIQIINHYTEMSGFDCRGYCQADDYSSHYFGCGYLLSSYNNGNFSITTPSSYKFSGTYRIVLVYQNETMV